VRANGAYRVLGHPRHPPASRPPLALLLLVGAARSPGGVRGGLEVGRRLDPRPSRRAG
jgi:hypothetical protein